MRSTDENNWIVLDSKTCTQLGVMTGVYSTVKTLAEKIIRPITEF